MDFLTRLKQPAPLLFFLGLTFGLVGGYVAGQSGAMKVVATIEQSFSPIQELGTSYTFIHPLLAYHAPEATTLGEYVSLKNNFQSIVDAATGSSASRVAIYFRDLNAGLWVGVNQNDSYYPASLLKVPAMIAYYKNAEENPAVLEQSITYDPSVLPRVPFDASSKLVAGTVYPVSALIKSMITDSDNGATFTLLNHVDPTFLHAVYSVLGIQDPGDNSANYQISARTYGLFFRILYNATYLTSDYSEQALKLLSQSTYTSGLVAGVPKGTVVAHKYGEHVLSNNGTATGVELSDCGIVYYPLHPYLMCVMASTPDTATADTIIANASRTAYSAIQNQYND